MLTGNGCCSQCCYGESPFSGMTQCNEGHLFCLDCARRNAENEVGRGRYRLLCMAGCKSEFPRREVLRFLDEKLILALEKNEQEEVLRIADLKGLTKCPFCDYAAICAPIDEDKEFRCGNPDCRQLLPYFPNIFRLTLFGQVWKSAAATVSRNHTFLRHARKCPKMESCLFDIN